MGTAAVSNNAHVLNFTGKAIAALPRDVRAAPGRAAVHRRADEPSVLRLHRVLRASRDHHRLRRRPVLPGRAGVAPRDGRVPRAHDACVELDSRRRTSTAFTDVVAGSLFAGHIEAMRTDGITSGCTATTYCPESSVTRAQMAVFILRARCGAGYVPNHAGIADVRGRSALASVRGLHREDVLARHHRRLRDRAVALLPRCCR